MKQTNERLCALAQKGDATALDSLIENNKSFIGKVANDLFRSMNLAQSGLNLDTDDLKQAGNMLSLIHISSRLPLTDSATSSIPLSVRRS